LERGDALTPTAEQLEEAITGAIATAHQLKTDARWLWTDAYWPPGKDRDRPTRVHPRTDRTDPDHVPGERLALGIGRDDVRAAYTQAATLLADAHRLAGRAVGHYTGRKVTGRVRPPRDHEFTQFADSTVRRLRWLAERDVAHDADEAPRLDAHAACVALTEAHGHLRKVLRDLDGSGLAPPDRRCDNPLGCDNPPRPGGKKCDPCARMWQRKKVHRQPRRYAEVRAAKVRRVERGEDYGENPLPGWRYVDGQLERSTPHPEQQSRKEAS
jgi:hypothetical protein